MNRHGTKRTEIAGLLAILAAGLSFTVSSKAHAQSVHTEARIETGIVTDESIDALDDDNTMTGGQIGIGWGFDNIVPGLRGLVTYRGAGIETGKERLGGAVDMTYSNHRFLLVGDYGYELWSIFRPFARLGAGYALQYLSLETLNTARFDYAHDLAGTLSAGLEVHTPAHWTVAGVPVTIGISSQGGYAYQTAAEFDELRYEEDEFGEDDPWQRQDLDAGTLDPAGWFWDLGLTASVRF